MKGSALFLVLLLAVASLAVGACGEEENGAGEPAATPATTAPAGEEVDGEVVFVGMCTGCHGEDGSGGVGPDLRGEDDLAAIESKVRSGGGAMPGFQDTLSDADISAVAEYVISL
jgi:mono/diheme cytochrome c family protein